MRIKANGINIHYEVDGAADAPWLVFSNSLATDLTMWDEQAAYFSKTYRVLRYDQRGHGRSDAPAQRYSFATLIADVLALMNELRIERANFCGLSMGGATVMGLAQSNPGRVERAIICDSPCASTQASARQWEERIAIARAQGMTALADSTIARWFPAETVAANPAYLTKIRQMILMTPVNGFIGCAAALADHDFCRSVRTLTRPVLFLAGEKDGTTPAAMRQMQSALAGSRFAEIPGAGHICNLERPDMFNRAIDDFLRSDEQSAPNEIPGRDFILTQEKRVK
jgi:3-oxoadipate enol-lactonase